MSGIPTGVATGIGSLPGDKPLEASALVVDALPELPHVPELPERGPWADMVGRAASVLVDLPAEWEGNRWQVTAREGRDVRRARALLAEDLDAVEDRLQGYAGPAKLQMCGPLTLAAVLEVRGGAAVADPGATADLAESLSEGLAAHLLDLRRRVPGADWVVQLDEPALSSVTGGTIPRPSGWGTIAAVPQADAARLLGTVTDAVRVLGAGVVVHSCTTAPDWAVLAPGSGCRHTGVSIDIGAVDLAAAAPAMEAWLDAGGVLWLGVDPGLGVDTWTEGESAALARLEEVRSTLGVAPERFAEVVAVTPPCGLAGRPVVVAASYAVARRLMARLRGDAPPDDVRTEPPITEGMEHGRGA